jgi:membrane protease YdiL (CAAX protease family)
MATATVALALASGASTADIGLDPRLLRRGLRFGVTAAGAIVAVVSTGVAVPRLRKSMADEQIIDTSARAALFEIVVRIPLETALAEELVFRGALLGLGLSNRTTVAAVATSSALFGIWHVQPTLQSLKRGAGNSETASTPLRRSATILAVVALTGLAGGALAGLRLRSGSVLAPVLAHAAINMTAFAGVRTTARP